jgi:hypothetical protein
VVGKIGFKLDEICDVAICLRWFFLFGFFLEGENSDLKKLFGTTDIFNERKM